MAPDYVARNEQWIGGLVVAVALFAVLAVILRSVAWPTAAADVPGEIGPGSTDGRDDIGSEAGILTFRDARAAAERRIVLEALARNDWRVGQTAAELGLADHASLLKIMRKHAIRRP